MQHMRDDIHDLDVVTLIKDLPAEGLSAGQTGTVVFVHESGPAYEVEFMIEPRRSVVATVERDHILKLKGLQYSRTGS